MNKPIPHFARPRMKELRCENNLSQKQLSEFLGCKQQTYSRYELGGLEIPLAYLAKLTGLYGTSADYILGLTDEKLPYKTANRTTV